MKKIFSDPFRLLVIVTAAVILSCYGKFIFHANDYLLSGQGDGVKNYYTPAWFVKYDKGTHFSGMNYPFGDHVVFTDDQPVLSGVLNFIDDHIFPVADYTTGIINLLIFISLFFSVLLIYKILIHYKLNKWFAFYTALLIGFGAPQIMRLTGHYALAYAIYFPLIWWMFIQSSNSGYKFTKSVLLMAVITFFSFIHIYYLFIALLFFGFYFIITIFSKKNSRREIISLLLILIIPFAFSIGFMKLTDHVIDRTSAPYGFFAYRATFQTVFLNPSGNLNQWLTKTFQFIPTEYEGFAYVGVGGLIVLLISVWIFFNRWIKKKKFLSAFIRLPENLGRIVFAAVFVLLFSMALPFSLGLQSLLDIIPFIKQFRSPGRLAWVFYYVFTVYASILIYLLFRLISQKNKIAALLFIFTLLFLQGRETVVYMRNSIHSIKSLSDSNPFNPENNLLARKLKDAGVNANDYQAILFFPSFFEGSEKLYIDRTGGDFKRALEISYQTGLPLVDQMMSRTSMSQSLELASLMGHPAIKKNIPEGFNDKPLLVISTGKNLVKGEHDIISLSNKIGSSDDLHFYSFDLHSLGDRQHLFTFYFKNNADSLQFFNSNYYSLDSNYIFYRNSFEDMPSRDPFFGNGSFYSEGTEKVLLARIPVNISETIWIEISYWVKAYSSTTSFPNLKIDFVRGNNSWLDEYSISAKYSTDIIGNWVRGSDNFEVKPDVKQIRIYCAASEQVNLDELVVRHTAYDMFYDVRNDSSFMYNNYPVNIPTGDSGD